MFLINIYNLAVKKWVVNIVCDVLNISFENKRHIFLSRFVWVWRSGWQILFWLFALTCYHRPISLTCYIVPFSLFTFFSFFLPPVSVLFSLQLSCLSVRIVYDAVNDQGRKVLWSRRWWFNEDASERFHLLLCFSSFCARPLSNVPTLLIFLFNWPSSGGHEEELICMNLNVLCDR